MHAINFARSSGLVYLHTPFSAIRHADRPQQEWANAWETFFNLGVGEKACDVERHQVVNYTAGKQAGGLRLFFGWENRLDELNDHFKALVPEFRHKYYTNKSPRTTEEVTVAVHVRRGWDVSMNDWLYTSTDSILRTITLVKAVLDNHSIEHKISVYSEGNSAHFGEICIPGVELSKYRVGYYSVDRVRQWGRRGPGTHPDTTGDAPSIIESVVDIDAISLARELIEADILIMSKGSLCYCAALISDGIKIYEDGWKPMMDDWLLRSPDGSFDTAALEHQLFLLLKAKGTICKERQLEDRPQ